MSTHHIRDIDSDVARMTPHTDRSACYLISLICAPTMHQRKTFINFTLVHLLSKTKLRVRTRSFGFARPSPFNYFAFVQLRGRHSIESSTRLRTAHKATEQKSPLLHYCAKFRSPRSQLPFMSPRRSHTYKNLDLPDDDKLYLTQKSTNSTSEHLLLELTPTPKEIESTESQNHFPSINKSKVRGQIQTEARFQGQQKLSNIERHPHENSWAIEHTHINTRACTQGTT